MKRNFMLTIYYKSDNTVDYFKYEYDEHDINNNQKVHVTHIIKKVGESYYETIQEQRVYNISLS